MMVIVRVVVTDHNDSNGGDVGFVIVMVVVADDKGSNCGDGGDSDVGSCR